MGFSTLAHIDLTVSYPPRLLYVSDIELHHHRRSSHGPSEPYPMDLQIHVPLLRAPSCIQRYISHPLPPCHVPQITFTTSGRFHLLASRPTHLRSTRCSSPPLCMVSGGPTTRNNRYTGLEVYPIRDASLRPSTPLRLLSDPRC